MEPTFRAFRFFDVTIGKNPGVYDSFEEACSQLVGFPKAEHQGFNSHLLAEGAFTAQIEATQDEKECVEEMQALLGDPKTSPPSSPPYVPTADGRIALLRGEVNLIPVDEVAFFPFPVCIDIEHWLAKICHDTSLPPLAYFRKEVALVTGGVAYQFSVVIPGNPLGVGADATGRCSALESDAKEDAAFYMLQKLLHAIGQHVRDYNYLTASLFRGTTSTFGQR
ncbi:hypothetical protein PIB30_051175 [Stylosanthes scabra]|uniref:Ribonuclease H1 N-terminal domain-containing protein n=1 Tax=Stylosanthes scabra TaxID=79078 RepID=A0ABU6UL77_9FABA|nr:hypothetical protein [Stylosanthes scabra]